MPLIAASSEVDDAADADTSVWSLLVPGTEDEERTEGNDLSLNVYSLGLRRTRYQGEGPVPNPIVEPGYSLRLSRGDSVFCVPQDDCPYLTGSVVILSTSPVQREQTNRWDETVRGLLFVARQGWLKSGHIPWVW